MNRPSWGLTLLIISCLIAIFTNPSTEDHKQEVKNILNRHLQESLSENKADGFENLGMLIGSSFAEKLIDNSVSRENYIFFSLTKGTWKDNSKIIGYGVFGNVFLSDDVKEAFDNKTYNSAEEVVPYEEPAYSEDLKELDIDYSDK